MRAQGTDLVAQTEAWYCLKAQVKRERVAAAGIRARIGVDVFSPSLKVRRKTRNGPKYFVEALFPGYLFVKCILSEHKRHLMAISGVSGIVHFSKHYPALSSHDMELLREQVEAPHTQSDDELFEQGDEVEIISGPFSQFYAKVLNVESGMERVALLIEFLGQDLNVSLPASDLYHPDEGRCRKRIIPALARS